ncbi:MAG: acyl transferase [Flavobacteriaceae bacterium]|nr:acyl transferase [Flavobacteriaceae bacterium]
MKIKSLNPFKIKSELDFKLNSIDLFKRQFNNNLIYNQYCKLLKIKLSDVKELNDIPFLPIQFFKTHKIISNQNKISHIFKSSGTGGIKSINYVSNINNYIKSFRTCFEMFYGPIKNYVFLGLLPSYIDQKNSSLVFMVNNFIETSNHSESEFYLDNYNKLSSVLKDLGNKKKKIILFGVSYALIDFAKKYPVEMKNLIIVETGGMKGRKKEITRDELHLTLKKAFGTNHIHSEYGMTELFSQAYSFKNGKFINPPWMKTLIRNINNPLMVSKFGRGAINIIDLANEHSCAFVATNDVGEVFKNKSYTISGRISEAEIRGCNLMFNDN